MTDGSDAPDAGRDCTPERHPDRDPTDHDWHVIESRAEYETGWYTGGYDLVEQPDGTEKKYYWAALPAAVVVVAAVDDPGALDLPGDGRSVVFVEQFRPTIRELCYELPAGIVEDGESYAEAGARELEEEAGLVADSVDLIEEFWCSTGVLRHRRGIVWADGFTRGDRKLDGNEFLNVRTVSVDEAFDLARSGPANDATLEGLLLARTEGLL